jgi:hypothetical protein
MIRLLVASMIVTAACTVAAQSPAKPAPIERSDPAVNETNRRFAICSGDPLDFLDNRDYCLRIGDWAAEE